MVPYNRHGYLRARKTCANPASLGKKVYLSRRLSGPANHSRRLRRRYSPQQLPVPQSQHTISRINEVQFPRNAPLSLLAVPQSRSSSRINFRPNVLIELLSYRKSFNMTELSPAPAVGAGQPRREPI